MTRPNRLTTVKHAHITFDLAKEAANRGKHGVSLAARLEWDTALIWTDDRMDYGEHR